MAEVVVFPDAEGLVVEFLARELAARNDTAVVSTRVPRTRPARMVKVTRVGGVRRDLVTDLPRVTLQCWDQHAEQAVALCGLVRGLLSVMPYDDAAGNDVRDVDEFGGLAYFPDPTTDLPRYQFTVVLNTRGQALNV